MAGNENKLMPIVSSALCGGGIGIIVDFVAGTQIIFTAACLVVGLVIGLVKSKKS